MLVSGAKRVYASVEQSELNRLRNQESRIRSLDRDLEQRVKAVRREADQKMRKHLDLFEQRQHNYERMNQDLQSELNNLERNTRQRIAQNGQVFVNKLKEQKGEFKNLINTQEQRFVKGLNTHKKDISNKLEKQKGEYTQLIREQGEYFSSNLKDERQARKHAIAQLQTHINSITLDADRKMDIARSFVSDISKLIVELDQLPHQRFAPGEMNKINRHIEDARQSLGAGMPEASLSVSQRSYWEFADLRALVLEREQEFTLIYRAAIQQASELLEEVRSNRRYAFDNVNEPEMASYDFEVDHWSHGELSAFEVEISEQKQHLIDNEKKLRVEEVRSIFDLLESMEGRSCEIVEHAKQNIIASQLRVNIAELAVDSLHTEGFDLIDEAYLGNDERNAFIAKVRNRAGSEVVTIIAPVEGDYGKNEITIHSHDKTFIDEGVTLQRTQEIADVLKSQGLLTQAPECVGEADHECLDIDAVRRGQANLREVATKAKKR
jgi:hypothetical protein